MRILKPFVFFLACAASGLALAQQPWPTSSSSGETLLAWNGGGHGGGKHFKGYRHGYGHKHYYRHRGYYNHGPRVIYAPRYYGGYYSGERPYYYQRYGSPRIVIQYYDPRLGIFIGSDIGGY
ncbi:hypothetical protein DM872_18705 [Pseudomonas taiwanensis]|uniref:hypothetical protein n=1 Tax=Pseudomonas taiwanensis TaxID=470150 RepID=UPI0015BE2A6E|nr:hypothetical protein [Pseudomonas taiwanensis]NWL78880.1 hypothetical protein [Pseudomonas taiwanensis]